METKLLKIAEIARQKPKVLKGNVTRSKRNNNSTR